MSRLAAMFVARERPIAIGLVVAWTLLYGILAVLRHATWNSTAFDLAVFDQVYWNATQGRFFESTLDREVCGPSSKPAAPS